MTIFAVKDGITCKFPNQEYEESFTEFTSILILTRSAIEIYYNLKRVFFLTVDNEDLFDFEYNSWKLSGYIINDLTVTKNYRNFNEKEKASTYLQILRDRIYKTSKFQNLSKKEQNNVINGNRIINWTEVSNTIGINDEKRKFLYRFLSSFVHANGFSVDQLLFSKSLEDTKVQIYIQIKILIFFLSLLIIDLYSLVSEIKYVCDNNKEAFKLAVDYSGVNIENNKDIYHN